MSQSFNLNQPLPKFSSRDVVEANRKYVDDRRKGLITSLKTKYPKLDASLMGGIETDTILCISALSGAGKSTIAKTVRDSIAKLNKSQKFRQYIFNFEMIAHQQIGRSIVSDANMPLRDLYSVDTPLTDDQYAKLNDYYEDLAERDTSFIEVPSTPKHIADSIRYYWEKECKPTGAVMIYEIDHALLVKGREGQSEKNRIDDLMYALVDVKKWIASQGGHSVGIVLSQMNREIKSVERRQHADMHRPDTSCLFGASSIEMCADYILFSHIPAKLGLQSYTEAKLPVRIKVDGKLMQMPYFELVKQRSGASDLTIPLWNKLDRFDFDEMDKSIFEKIHREFLEGECTVTPEVQAQYKLI